MDLNLELARLEALCSRREYAEKDLLEKLKRRSVSESDSAKILQSLKEKGFVSNQRYAEAFVRDKSRLAGWGEKKIAFCLKTKAISDDIVKEALSEIDIAVAQKRMMEVLENKLKQLSRETDLKKKKEKLIRFALSRGYRYDQILEIINKIL